MKYKITRRHSVERTYLRQRCSHLNETILKPRLAAATGRANTHIWNFPKRSMNFLDIIKFRIAAHTISEKAIRFQHPDYNPDRVQKLISSSMSRHLSTRNISAKSMHAFLSNLANRQSSLMSLRLSSFGLVRVPPWQRFHLNIALCLSDRPLYWAAIVYVTLECT